MKKYSSSIMKCLFEITEDLLEPLHWSPAENKSPPKHADTNQTLDESVSRKCRGGMSR